MNASDLVALNEEIAGMARAGLPLDQGLAALAQEMGRGRLQRVTAAIAEDLRAGRTLPEALQRQEGRVPPFYAGLVSAGVRTGRIGEVLATLTTYARSMAGLRAIVIDALFYPAVVVTFAAVLIGYLCYYLLPQFDRIFHDFHMHLPVMTELVYEVSRQPLLYIVAPILTVVVLLVLLRLGLRVTERGRRTWARLIYAIPVAGTLIRTARLAAFTDLLAILVDHELPLPEAFRLAGEASSDPIMAAAVGRVQHDLNQGVPLGAALRGAGLVPEWVAWMAGLGERRGALGPALHQVAAMYRRQAEVRAALLRSVLPPFLVLCTAGLFVSVFVLTMMLPMYALLEGLSK
jgi:type II secretory pathway component PulF